MHDSQNIKKQILIIEAKEMHYFSNLFDKVLYMFHPDYANRQPTELA
jgi:transcription initiation factor IIF auxiliary subunit